VPRNALYVQITDPDLAYAQEKDQWNCVIVRAIQRKLPEALRVHANEKRIEFTLPDDGPTGTRYVCDTPSEIVAKVIKPFDEGRPIPAEDREFSLTVNEAHPVVKASAKSRNTRNHWQRRDRAGKIKINKSKNPNVKSYGRFLEYSDAEIAEMLEETL
jgi:hypothetical protein